MSCFSPVRFHLCCPSQAKKPLSAWQIGMLETLELQGTNASVPEATQEQGLAAVRQYYEQLQADAVISEHLKVVITGNGRVGKTSLVQRLQEH